MNSLAPWSHQERFIRKREPIQEIPNSEAGYFRWLPDITYRQLKICFSSAEISPASMFRVPSAAESTSFDLYLDAMLFQWQLLSGTKRDEIVNENNCKSDWMKWSTQQTFKSMIPNTVATSPVVLRWLCDSPRTGCAWRTTPYIYVARTSNNRVIMACELYCCLLPQCEA